MRRSPSPSPTAAAAAILLWSSAGGGLLLLSLPLPPALGALPPGYEDGESPNAPPDPLHGVLVVLPRASAPLAHTALSPPSPLPGSKHGITTRRRYIGTMTDIVLSKKCGALPESAGFTSTPGGPPVPRGVLERIGRPWLPPNSPSLLCPPPSMFQKCHDASTNSTTEGTWTGSYVETRPPDWYVRPPPCDSGEVGDGVTFGEWILENPDGVLQEVRRGRATERGRLGSNFWPATPSTALSRSSLKVRN